MQGEKTQVKARKDKKKNTQTGILMGQNTNIFSQLSASYLNNKPHTTQQQESFVKETQIIQYHDQNINRLISLLRKKAQVTKVKAILELKEEIKKMNEDNIQQFLPTYSNLYMQIVVNEQSKQVYDEFVDITTYIFQNFKKNALKQIQTFYPALLISIKLSKVASLLFNGIQQQILNKCIILFSKKQIKKKFISLSKILLQNQQVHLFTQSNFQRNIQLYVKAIKELVNIFQTSKTLSKQTIQKQFSDIISEVSELSTGKYIDQYFKVGGKGKASLLQLYSIFVKLGVQNNWDLNWQKYAKLICQQFLDKDATVQQTLWKSVNKSLLHSLILTCKQIQSVPASLSQYLPKYDDKIIQVISIGGFSLYKNLTSYLQQFPTFNLVQKQSHKSVVQKITFIRKLVSTILNQEDQNQARIQCYYQLCQNILSQMSNFQSNNLKKIIQNEGQKIQDSKKYKEIISLINKTKKEIVQNLQKKFYSDPPTSKNSFSYYIPSYFCKLLNVWQIPLIPVFNNPLTFSLYKEISQKSQLLKNIYQKCEGDLKLTLQFLQNWHPLGPIKADMTEQTQNHQKIAQIYMLANKENQESKDLWFKDEWSFHKSIIIYDPRITEKQLLAQLQQNHTFNLEFHPLMKTVPALYQFEKLNRWRFNYFFKMLENQDVQIYSLKYFLPYLFDNMLDKQNISILYMKYVKLAQKSKNSKWIIGERQICFIRIMTQAIVRYMNKQPSNQMVSQFGFFFETIGQFLRALNNYKMDQIVQELLRTLHKLLSEDEYETILFECTRNTFKEIFKQLVKSNISKQLQDKIRKNRLKRINHFVQRIVDNLIRKKSDKQFVLLADVFSAADLWEDALNRIQPWSLCYIFLHNCQDKYIQISKFMLEIMQKNCQIIGLILSCQLLLPLQIQPNIKQVFVKLQNSIKNLISEVGINEQISIVNKLALYQYENYRMTTSLGIRSLVKHCLKNYQSIQKDSLQKYKEECIDFFVFNLLKEDHNQQIYFKKVMICCNLISQYPFEDIPEIQVTYEKLTFLLQELIKNNCSEFKKLLACLKLVSIFWQTKFASKSLELWQQKKILQQLLDNLIPLNEDIQPLSIFHKYVIFSVLNGLYPLFGSQILQKFLQKISLILWQKNDRQQLFYTVMQEQKIKYINKTFLDSNQVTKQKIISQLPKEAFNEYCHYEKVLQELQQQQDDQLHSTQQSVHSLFVEYAELLIKMTTALKVNIAKQMIPSQTVILQLLQCPFSGVKKASYILLKQMYELQLVTPQIPKIYSSLLMLKLSSNSDIQQPKVALQIYNFLYNWLIFINRRKVTQNSKNQEDNNLSIQDYIQNQNLSDCFLTNIFVILSDILEYDKNEMQYQLTANQILYNDFTFNVQQQTDIAKKIFFITTKLLFNFTINFPLFLRNFMDKSKKYKNTCQRLLRNVITDAIFAQQLSVIEMKEHQWKSQGNFQIYVTRKTKQIYAQYTHDVIRIGLRLVMKTNYPLTPIHIEFGESLKMQQRGKWALMLQSQLHNRNNTLINGILLWKQNIDKKLSGVEQCSICFDIVNKNGQLPKKGCKTCKKKFHGNCIMKWFQKSNKSQCPLCKSQFL